MSEHCANGSVMDSSREKREADIDVNALGFTSTTPSEVVLLVDQCRSSLSIAEWACKSIASFTDAAIKKRNAEAMAQLLDEGICECLVNCMHAHCANSAEVASSSCHALSDMCWMSRDLREYLGELGACECVVFALNMHMGDADVAENGTAAVINLCKDNITNSFRVAEADGCDIVVQTGNFGFNLRHPKSATIAGNVCTAVSHMCEAKNQRKLAESGACDLVASLLKFHMSSYEVVLAATRALCGLASLTSDNREVLGRAGGCGLLVQAMATHEEAVDIKQHCCEAIMHMALSATNTEKLAQAGACEAVVRALEEHLLERDFGAEICCGAMLNLITYGAAAPSNTIRLRMAGAGPLMERVNRGLRASQRAIESAKQIAHNIQLSETPVTSVGGGLVGVVLGSGAIAGPGAVSSANKSAREGSSSRSSSGPVDLSLAGGAALTSSSSASAVQCSAGGGPSYVQGAVRDGLLVADEEDDSPRALERTTSADDSERDVYEI